jgi:uncharacterized membrane protein required for colicin V production
MSPFDFALFAIVVAFALGGYNSGFIRGAVGLIALALGLLFAAAWYDQLAATMLANLPRPIAKAAAFGTITGLFAAAGGILGAILARSAKPLFAKLPEFSAVDRILGMLTGAVDGLITCTVFVFIMLAVPGTAGMMRDSRLGEALVRGTQAVGTALPSPIEESFVYAWNDLSTGWQDLDKR